MTDNDELFKPPAATDDMRRRATEKGWPSDLHDRMLALRFPSWKIEQGLEAEGWPTVDMYVAEVADREALANGTLTVRIGNPRRTARVRRRVFAA